MMSEKFAASCQWPVASGQLPVVSAQLPVVSAQLPVAGSQWSVDSSQPPVTPHSSLLTPHCSEAADSSLLTMQLLHMSYVIRLTSYVCYLQYGPISWRILRS